MKFLKNTLLSAIFDILKIFSVIPENFLKGLYCMFWQIIIIIIEH